MENFLPIALLFACLLALCEVGYWVGGQPRFRSEHQDKSRIETILAQVMTLLALLLGFSVSIADNHHAARKQFAVDEANAIGTAFLRTKVVPEPEQKEIGKLLRHYAATRASFYDLMPETQAANDNLNLTKKIQTDLWDHATLLGQTYPQLITTGLLLDSLNRVMDIEESQRAAFANGIPGSIIVLLAFGSIVGMSMVGFQLGTSGSRYFVWTSLLALLLASTLFVVVDLDKSQQGFIRVHNESLDRLSIPANDDHR